MQRRRCGLKIYMSDLKVWDIYRKFLTAIFGFVKQAQVPVF